MHSKIKCFNFLFFTIIILFFAVFVLGQTTFNASVSIILNKFSVCGNVETSSEIITQINATGNCFRIIADNLALNCSGFLIQGNSSGIAINTTNRNNVTIKNCAISNFSKGLFQKNSNMVVIDKINISQTTVEIELIGSQIVNSNISNTRINTSSGIDTFTNISFTNTTIIADTETIFNNDSLSTNSNLVASNILVRVYDSIIGAHNFTNTTLSISRNNNSEVNFSVPIIGEGSTSLTSLVVLTNGSARVNSTSASYLNQPAHLTFYPSNLVNLEPTVDSADNGNFITCPQTLCQDTETTLTNFNFNVMHFTTFSFRNVTPVPPGPSPAPSGGGGGGGGQVKGPTDLEVSPDIIESFLKSGESKEFILELRNGLQKRDLQIILEGSEFMFLNNGVKSFSLSLPPNEKWRTLLTVSLPKNVLGIHLGKIIIKGVNLEKVVNVRIVAGTGLILKESPKDKEEDLLETELRKRTIEKPSPVRRQIVPYARTEIKKVKQNNWAGWLIGSMALILIIIMIQLQRKFDVYHQVKMMVAGRNNKERSIYHLKEKRNYAMHHTTNDGHIQKYVEELAHMATPPVPRNNNNHLRLPPPIMIHPLRKKHEESAVNMLKKIIGKY